MIKLKVAYSPIVSFPMQQNHISFLQRIEISNPAGTAALKDVEVSLVSDPGFIKECRLNIDGIDAGKTFTAYSVKTIFSTDVLMSLTERIEGSFDVIVTVQGKEICRKTYPVTLLAFDQWLGDGKYPELILSFVTPNHPAIASILKRASKILEDWTGEASLEGYQSGRPERVKFQMGAIYQALAEQGISYSNPPANFEDSGQRIRLAGRIFSDRLATCLDIALLYAGCLEAAGIHPLLVLNRKHAYAGGWLVDSTFADCVNDDCTLLSKRLAAGINEVLLVETTGMTEGGRLSFDEAVVKGEAHVHDDAKDFGFFLDIKKGREEHIRPLPLMENGTIDPDWENTVSTQPGPPSGINGEPRQIDPFARPLVDKQTIWERKLLDLSMKNNLLSIPRRGGYVQIMAVGLDKVEDLLAGKEPLNISGVPAGTESTDYARHRSLAPGDFHYASVSADLGNKRLRTFLPETELQGRLTTLYRNARTAMEENGANTLFLTLGTLKWYEPDNPKTPRYAPLLLVPVEITRRSAMSGYNIRGRDEDTMFNITLQEMLRQFFQMEIPGLNPLPKDSKGVDLCEVFSIIRRCIMEYKGWDLEETAMLGNFSFNKFVMWNDIHSNAEVMKSNPLVNSLLTGVVDSEVNKDVQTGEDLDAAVAPGEIMLPIGADSSQLEAIEAAMSGKSFILHGPPGTGKSQSITNIIANAIYQGKKVLFVAEKMAALEVVQKRLEEIGLAPFCLELHSNKAKKSAVMEQFRRVVEVTKKASSEQFGSEADRIKNLRLEIKTYLDTLHKPYPLGVSLYDCLSRYCSYADGGEPFKPALDWLLALSKDDITRIEDAMSQYITACSVCGGPAGHPLSGVKATRIPSGDLAAALSSLQTERMCKSLKESYRILFSEDAATLTKTQVEAFRNLAGTLMESGSVTPALLGLGEDGLATLENAVREGHRCEDLAGQIRKTYSPRILAVPAETFINEYEAAMAKGAIGRLFALNTLRRKLAVYANGGRRPEKENLQADIDLLAAYGKSAKALKTAELQKTFGADFGKRDEDWDNACEGIAAARAIDNDLIALFGRDRQTVAAHKARIAEAVKDGHATFRKYEGHVLDEFIEAFEAFKAGSAALLADLEAELPDGESAGWADLVAGTVRKWMDNIGKLRGWTVYNREKANIAALGLGSLAEAVENGGLKAEESISALWKGIYKTYAEYIISQEPVLEEFNGVMFEEKIRRFRKLCGRFEDLTRKELYAKAASNLPALQREASNGSSVGILQKNIRNNCRGTSLRSLFDKIQDILPRIFPCMLMSPLSVAQYLDAGGFKFDLVIFDEASQMPTSEAVGTIARGKSVIVAGDPNQMPPTNFFAINNFDEDNAAIEDLESILDDCLALSLPSMYLKWHYRSRHESLIAFSNTKYYGGRLLTFPSPDDLKTKLLYQYVPDGIYEKGGSRQNRAEAQAIIEEIKERLSDPARKGRSIGVITFNTNQQSLIEDLLGDLFKANPQLENAARECGEEIFIKNLENVQGDERDVILFSVGYGPDSRGNVTLNFGPLNRDGGWRRLNVAVSRARYEMKVFSTLRSDQINLSRTNAEGVAGLKSFLEYAERGRDALLYNTASSSHTDDNVVLAIAGRLRSAGYNVGTNIGCSGYRIDIGVIDPDNPDKYILGILCDGYNSDATRTVRDREIVQTGVLKSLGWNVHRIWTMDWWNDPDKVIAGVVEAIENPSPAEEEPAETEPLEQDAAPESLESEEVPSTGIPYEAEDGFVMQADIDDFNNGGLDHKISMKVQSVLDKEAPVSLSLLNRRMAQAFGFQQVGQRMKVHLAYIYDEKLKFKSTEDGDRKFYWKDSQNPDGMDFYRTGNSRDAMDIAPQEVGAAVLEIIEEQGALSHDDLTREAAKRFGYARLGDKVLQSMTAGISLLTSSGRIRLKDDGKYVK